uniref:very-long-chain 3-oxoacyl-CoA synthase n=1 Tax=Oryza barthii TaxID=65489 RepID=A0A0D3FS04_9ORYZ
MVEKAWTSSVSFSYGALVGLLPFHFDVLITNRSSTMMVVMTAMILVVVGVLLLLLWRARRRRGGVYLVDYGCFLGEPRHRVPFAMALEHGRLMTNLLDEESTNFMVRLHQKSGIGEETSVPDSFRKREMLVPNVLFRMGAAAIIMSNSPEKARFRLGPIVRTLTAARDGDYRCAFQEEDDEGITGINLSKDLPVVAANALKGHLVAFGLAVLPTSELLRVAISFINHKIINKFFTTTKDSNNNYYRPGFHRLFQHFCIHPGGRRVLDEVQRGLGLTDDDMEASHMTLHRFGNMASSSLLYELAYIEAKGRMKKGDRVCMISFSPGIDCSSVVWECIKPTDHHLHHGPWAACIDRYPVQLPKIVKRPA